MAYWIFAFVLFAGTTYAKPSRIVGGNPTTVDNYPSVVQVDYQNTYTNTWSHNCGGNILTTRTILSAAHCFDGPYYAPHLRRIRAGTTYRNIGGQINYVLAAVNHPTWNRLTGFEGDITVVRLMTPLVYNSVVARTSIPPQGTLMPGNLPVVHAGWGVTFENGPTPLILQDVTVVTVDNTRCAEIYRDTSGGPIDVSKNMICSGILGVGGKGFCTADSGGPMFYGNITMGIVAFGKGCGRPNYPGVSTAISSYTNWITANTV